MGSGAVSIGHSVSWLEVVKGVRNQGVDCSARAVFSVSGLWLGCMWCFVSSFWLSVPVQSIA